MTSFVNSVSQAKRGENLGYLSISKKQINPHFTKKKKEVSISKTKKELPAPKVANKNNESI